MFEKHQAYISVHYFTNAAQLIRPLLPMLWVRHIDLCRVRIWFVIVNDINKVLLLYCHVFENKQILLVTLCAFYVRIKLSYYKVQNETVSVLFTEGRKWTSCVIIDLREKIRSRPILWDVRNPKSSISLLCGYMGCGSTKFMIRCSYPWSFSLR